MQLLFDPVTLVNLILCIVIVILSIIEYVDIRSTTPLFIGAAFFLFGISHVITLLGLNTALELEIIIVRALGYISICVGVYLIIREIIFRMKTEEALKVERLGLERRINERTAELQQVNEVLRANRRQLTDIIEFLPEATLAIDKERRVIIWNKAIEKMTGIPAAEIIGKGGHAYTIPFYGEARPQLMDLVFGSHEEIAARYLNITREDDTLTAEVFCNALYNNKGAWVFAKVSPLHDQSGNIIGAIESIRDITERKQNEIALLQKTEELHAANEQLIAAEEELKAQFDALAKSEQMLWESERRVRKKLENLLSPGSDIGSLDLADIIDTQAIQSMMEDFHSIMHIPSAILDIHGNVLVATGWQDICTKFHRVNLQTGANCVESDTFLSNGVAPGTFKLYRCKNNLWDIVTPITMDGNHVGNLFLGQFLFEDESVDYELFRSQAMQYGFEETSYFAALDRVPRLNRETIDKVMAFYSKFAWMISTLSHSNITLARTVTERDTTLASLVRVNQKLNVISQLTREDLTNRIFVLSSYLELAKDQLAGQDRIIETVQKGVLTMRSIHETIEYSKDYQDMGTKPSIWQNVKMTMLFGLSHISIGKIQYLLETENLEIFADPLLEKVCQRLFENSLVHGDHVTRIRVWHTVTPGGLTIIFEDDGIGIPQEKKEQIFLGGDGTHASMRSLIFVREILDITGIAISETGEPGKGARFDITVPNGTYRFTGTR